MRMPFKAPPFVARLSAAKGFYWTVLPLALAALSLLLFAATGILHGVWSNGWLGTAMLLVLCFETFFLPYVLLPLALRVPTLLPWVRFNPKVDFGVSGEGRLPQRILLGVLILLPGLPVLAAYDNHIVARASSSWHAPLEIVAGAGAGTLAVFVILAAVLAIPDFGGETQDR